jgi:hypothetical protein
MGLRHLQPGIVLEQFLRNGAFVGVRRPHRRGKCREGGSGESGQDQDGQGTGSPPTVRR